MQSSLKGEAAQIISSLSATDDNYKIAWDLLNERYQNKKAIIHSHLKSIFDLPNVPKESHACLRKFLDSFQIHFRSLKNLGESVDQWNTILVYLLNTKLDSTFRKEWEIYTKTNDAPKIDDFTKFLSQRCQLLESIDTKINTPGLNQITQRKFNDNNRNWPVDKHNYVHVSSNNLCPLCNEPHFIYSCKRFTEIPVNKRLFEAKRFNLCTNYLRNGHANSECKSLHSCRTCRSDIIRYCILIKITTPIKVTEQVK